MEALFTGASPLPAEELGMDNGGEGTAIVEPEKASRTFQQWAESLNCDQDLACDARMMVPIFYDEGRGKTKVWAFLGWQSATWTPGVHRSAAHVVGRERIDNKGSELEAAEQPLVAFSSGHYALATPVVAEVYVTRLLNRDEFRRHCDHYRTRWGNIGQPSMKRCQGQEHCQRIRGGCDVADEIPWLFGQAGCNIHVLELGGG